MEFIISSEQTTQGIAKLFASKSFIAFEEIALKFGLTLPEIMQLKPDVEKELRKKEHSIRLTSMMHTTPSGIFVDS